jgi:hypothetical protein
MFTAAKVGSAPATRMFMRRRRTPAWRRVAAGIIFPLLALIAWGCGSQSMTPSTTIDLSGTWSGSIGSGSGGGRALRLTWSATQTGNTVSGPATLTTSPAVSDLTFTGTLSGTVTGTQLSLRYVSKAGAIAGVPDCLVSGQGTGTAMATSISGQLDVVFTACDSLGLQAPTSSQFTLTRQETMPAAAVRRLLRQFSLRDADRRSALRHPRPARVRSFDRDFLERYTRAQLCA